jgi:hypothetical protein
MNTPSPDKEQSSQDSPDPVEKKKRRWTVDVGIAAIIASSISVLGGVAISVLSGVAIGKAGDNATPAPTVTATVTAAPTAPVSDLGFYYGSPYQIAWCSSLDGKGAIPADDALLIFDTPTDQNGQPLSSPSYSFDGEAMQVTSARWQLNPLYIGVPGAKNFHDEIFGVVVSDTDYQFILSIATSNNGKWKSGKLPAGQEIQLLVVTKGTRNECVPKPG